MSLLHHFSVGTHYVDLVHYLAGDATVARHPPGPQCYLHHVHPPAGEVAIVPIVLPSFLITHLPTRQVPWSGCAAASRGRVLHQHESVGGEEGGVSGALLRFRPALHQTGDSCSHSFQMLYPSLSSYKNDYIIWALVASPIPHTRRQWPILIPCS